MSGLVRSGQARSDRSGLVRSGQVRSDRSSQVKLNHVWTSQVRKCQFMTGQVKSVQELTFFLNLGE